MDFLDLSISSSDDDETCTQAKQLLDDLKASSSSDTDGLCGKTTKSGTACGINLTRGKCWIHDHVRDSCNFVTTTGKRCGKWATTNKGGLCSDHHKCYTCKMVFSKRDKTLNSRNKKDVICSDCSENRTVRTSANSTTSPPSVPGGVRKAKNRVSKKPTITVQQLKQYKAALFATLPDKTACEAFGRIVADLI